MKEEDDEWNVSLKELPHQYAVLIKSLVKASSLKDISAMKKDLLAKSKTIVNELNKNVSTKHRTVKIEDYMHKDPPYKPYSPEDAYDRYMPKSTTRKKPVSKKAVTKKPKKSPPILIKGKKVRKDKGVKRGPQKNPKNPKK